MRCYLSLHIIVFNLQNSVFHVKLPKKSRLVSKCGSYPKISIEPGVENLYTQKFLYGSYIYNTTE
ncbi:hypothetical protein HanRHA438_Chr08g0335151 [Helianthus annuus]|nr:hypothetical protein HanRHA438_Chr08g0335151 [Helianthus annuus]